MPALPGATDVLVELRVDPAPPGGAFDIIKGVAIVLERHQASWKLNAQQKKISRMRIPVLICREKFLSHSRLHGVYMSRVYC